MSTLTKKLETAGPFLRDIVFGVHDALLTNIGLVTGFVTALQTGRLIIVAAVVDVFISAFAMAIGTYLSRTSESDYLKQQLDSGTHQEVTDVLANPISAAVVMWVSYVVSGFIPLIPFFFGLSPIVAVQYGVGLALIIFFIVGALKGLITATNPWKSGFQFILFGAVAALIGYGIGHYGRQMAGSFKVVQ